MEPSSTSQIFTVQSLDPEIIFFPSTEIATEVTYPLCPSREWIREPSSTSQIFTVLSLDPETIFFPSTEIATEVTQF